MKKKLKKRISTAILVFALAMQCFMPMQVIANEGEAQQTEQSEDDTSEEEQSSNEDNSEDNSSSEEQSSNEDNSEDDASAIDQSSEDKSENDTSEADQSSEEKSETDTPAAEQPAEEKSETDTPAALEQPSEEKSESDTPAIEQPAEEKLESDTPAIEQPAEEKSESDTPAIEQPSEEKPEADTPAAIEQPSEEKSESDTPAIEQPSEEKSESDTPAIEQPSEEKPEADTPTALEQPTVEQPVEEQPTVEQPVEETTTQSIEYVEHKVSVVTKKQDDEGNPVVGAVLQILDSEGNVVDEWTSDGEEHISLLPEGDYILHEKEAPEGYTIAGEDTNFSVKVEIQDVNAGVVHDDGHDVCWHYLGVPLYYVESNGEKEEVYCINQGWDEPHDINYDGKVLDIDNIKTLAPDSDPTITNEELYNKVLDIVYRRSKASEEFPDLSVKEIRFITEYALKNYTSTLVNNSMYRKYVYDPNEKKGFYVTDEGNGTAIGQLASHWWVYHGRTVIPAKYAELFDYLINGEETHPEDMHLYIYSTGIQTEEGESYQNLLGVRWFDPYDENYEVYLTAINTKKPEEPEPEEPKPDEPKPDEPKPDEPKPDEPKPDEPKPEEPKPDEPKPDEPKPEEPVKPERPHYDHDDDDDDDDDDDYIVVKVPDEVVSIPVIDVIVPEEETVLTPPVVSTINEVPTDVPITGDTSEAASTISLVAMLLSLLGIFFTTKKKLVK